MNTKKKPLIVGVDPGSTSAVAAVNLNGEIELLESGKNFPPRKIIQRIIKVGKPLVTAGDKGKTPSKVSKISSSLGTRLFEPREDLSQERKKELGKGANSHELDALASAIHAQKQLHKEIQKIQKLEEDLDKTRIEIAEKIFNEEQVNRDEDEGGKSVRKSGETENVSEEDEEKLRLERKIENLENHVQKLKSELGEKESRNESLKAKISRLREEERKEIRKEEEVQKKEAQIKQKNQEIQDLEKELEDYKIREKQYRKAIRKIYSTGYELVPIVDGSLEKVPEKAVTRQNRLVKVLEERGCNIYHVEQVDGIELSNFFLVEDFPEPKNFETIIENYKNTR